MRGTMAQDDLKKLIKESVREVIREERLGLCEIMIPALLFMPESAGF